MGASAFLQVQQIITDSSSSNSERATQLKDPSAGRQLAPEVIYSPLKFSNVINIADLVSPVGQQAAAVSLHAHRQRFSSGLEYARPCVKLLLLNI
jgi:hypothetical protein